MARVRVEQAPGRRRGVDTGKAHGAYLSHIFWCGCGVFGRPAVVGSAAGFAFAVPPPSASPPRGARLQGGWQSAGLMASALAGGALADGALRRDTGNWDHWQMILPIWARSSAHSHVLVGGNLAGGYSRLQ